MQRLLVQFKDIKNGQIDIRDKKQVHYLKNVLRVKHGGRLIVFDEMANEYAAEIKSMSQENIVLSVKPAQRTVESGRMRFSVACAIPKKSKMDDIIDKLTQLGVDRIIPLETERVVARLNRDKKKLKLERWKKIAISASQQSQRNTLPVIEKVQSVKEALGNFKTYDLKIIPTLSGERINLSEAIFKSQPKDILIFIGPEGDFSDGEIEIAKKCGCIPVTLGKFVLRVETAAVAAASFIRFHENN